MTTNPRVSSELKQKVTRIYNRYKSYRIEPINPNTKFVDVPVYIDGVLDKFRYNVQEQRFDKVTLTMAKGGNIAGTTPFGAAYCDEVEFVSLPLPIEDIPNDN